MNHLFSTTGTKKYSILFGLVGFFCGLLMSILLLLNTFSVSDTFNIPGIATVYWFLGTAILLIMLDNLFHDGQTSELVTTIVLPFFWGGICYLVFSKNWIKVLFGVLVICLLALLTIYIGHNFV